MNTVEMLDDLIKTAAKSEADLRKFDSGNTAAGIRARKRMQVIRQKAKKIRFQIQRVRKERKIAKSTSD